MELKGSVFTYPMYPSFPSHSDLAKLVMSTCQPYLPICIDLSIFILRCGIPTGFGLVRVCTSSFPQT